MPKSKIDQTLKKIIAETSKESSKSSYVASNTSYGDPNCPICHGVGYLRQDLPIEHPDFGKIWVCECRRREVADQIRDRLFSLSNLDELSHLTFETFKLHGRKSSGELQTQSLEWAFNHARQFSGTLTGWLLLQGGYGSGKTHLAAAIANFAVQMGVPTLFLTVPDLLDSLRFAYDSNDTTFEERFEQIRNAQLLIMDDFGTQNATDWAREKLFQIINYRYINHLPIVITTNLAMEEIEARIRSRLQDPELVTTVRINATDYRRPVTDLGHPELSSLDLFPNKTFDTFLDRRSENLSSEDIKSLQEVIKAARKYAEKPGGWLVITGTYGSGKTHIAAAIANYQASLGVPPLFIMVHDLLDHLRAAFSPSSGTSYDRRFDEVRTSPLLILDDLGAQSATPWAKEKLNQLFAYRYNAELPTVITVATDALPELEKRISVKILDESISTVYRISAPAFRGSKEKQKVRKHL